MLNIYVEIDGQEQEVKFFKNENLKTWIADCLIPDEFITIDEIDGTLEETTLSMSIGISTPKIIVYERILDSFIDYKEDMAVGFEPTDENLSNENLIEPYNPDDIKVRREGFSVFEVNRMMISKDGDIDLNPDFQRNLVWDNTRKSALIESILLGIPIPVFYFAETKSGNYNVVDGLQRLSTIKQYLNNEFYLKKLEHLGEDCNNRYYMKPEDDSEFKPKRKYLDRKYTRRLENAQLIVNVIEHASPQKVKYDIFKRLNTGGRPLNKQEVRNCIATKEVRKFLKASVLSEEFLKATGESVNDNRMDAQELVLRFTGFRAEREGRLVYGGDMNSFLDSTMDLINDFSELELERYKLEFINSLKINYHLFGEFCFRKCLTEHLITGARKQFINKALFVTWSMINFDNEYEKIKQSFGFGEFSKILAEELDQKGKYYTILTTGTSDKNNLKDAITIGRNLLLQNNIVW
ncbi:DUF262 domain-containing protein [Flavobacterium sp. MR2016-29]|uniref:DUF262 domain-containing protein n=1 Tax=Flavobacterium sp. MR2016-29 TaxID=2783795 RepID=UPI00188CD102|nr:DUF262 domain-containing protein [Flavobacterium sp. MR2016-29]MBF4493188.1 DUF262 domain-containing protein [Flavobacterium sp. MR2016-29]